MLRKKAKNNFQKDFSKLMNNAVFGKTMKSVRKHRCIKLVTTERRRNYLVSEPSIRMKMSREMKRTQILMTEPVYLRFSKLILSKTVMYEFWYDYVKLKHGENAKLCCMATGSFIVHVKTDDIYKVIAEYVKRRFDTSNLN